MSKIHIKAQTGKRPTGATKSKKVTAPPQKHAHKGIRMIPNAGIKAQGTLMAKGKQIPQPKGSGSSKAKKGKMTGHITKSLNKFSNSKYEKMRKDVFGLAKKEDNGEI